ncbi:hypothetical protein RBA41_28305 [Massilia sp. CCM 9210]|uniref:hypothetical protein n=1 Tax=Massilia scottii TaxID=3057166 RepID=UPI0027969ABD|nr:hypothetical protein [Massilia sp. CCM 9210]MDQ1817213.1 hypothetical protein [Massilia sp. CCM 9210]
MTNLEAMIAEATAEIDAEKAKKAKTALIGALRRLDSAKQMVRNVEAEIADLKESIVDGSFA